MTDPTAHGAPSPAVAMTGPEIEHLVLAASAPRAPLAPVQQPGPMDLPPPAHLAPIAPFPLIDRFPTVVGSNLSLTYISSVYRLALTGYRREFCDVLSELREKDPHLSAVLQQRVLTVAGGRLQITPSDPTNRRARNIATAVDQYIRAMPDLVQSIATLAFSGLYFGIGACEISWARDGLQWRPTRLHFIHSRRLNFPDPGSWDLRIWDQGQVYPFDVNGNAAPDVNKTAKLFGIKAIDFPGKFLVYQPQLYAEYPTREGLGRTVAIWSALKSMGARSAAQFIERFSKPWAIATYTTKPDGKPRAAEQADVLLADAALRAVGSGSMAGATIPDSIKVELQQLTGAGQLNHEKWISICNKELSKAVLGQTDTTDGGNSGSKARAQTQKSGSNQLARFDALTIASAIKRDLVDWICRLNWPNDLDKRPNVAILVDPDPDPGSILDNAFKAASAGAPVDADKVCEQAGVPLLQKGDLTGRILVPVSPADIRTVNPDRFGQLPLPIAPPVPGAPGANVDNGTNGTSSTNDGSGDAANGSDGASSGDGSDT